MEYFNLLGFVVFLLCQSFVTSSIIKLKQNKRTCIVGAGVAGLSTARHLAGAGEQFVVLEATSHLGGTWYFEPRVGKDEYGRPIHSSMYKYLRSNVPYQTMELPGFPLPPGTPSFPNGTIYYQYLQSFADNFDLRKYIKLLHEVMLIYRENEQWKVKYVNVATGEEHEECFDYVIIATGHYSKPKLPNISGEDRFKGTIIHSHDYREPEPYINRRILVVGAGPSALDIGITLGEHAKKLVHSHHSKTIYTPFPKNYIQKPDIEEFTEDGVRFKDGTYEEIDDVIYCTGYEYYYPFIDKKSSGLSLKAASVTPLHRYLVNINNPTMMILGAIVKACAISTISTQSLYAAALVSGRAKLPSQAEMMQDWQQRVDNLIAQGRGLPDIHTLEPGMEQNQYYQNLTTAAGVTPVAPVIAAMCVRDAKAKHDNFYTFRDYVYTVIDDQYFTREYRPRRTVVCKCRQRVHPVEENYSAVQIRGY